MKRSAVQPILTCLLPAVAWAGQQPSQPGWPKPVENNRRFGYAILNQNELRTGEGQSSYRWDGEAWYGDKLNRAWVKTEGSLGLDSGTLDEAEVRALYSRAIRGSSTSRPESAMTSNLRLAAPTPRSAWRVWHHSSLKWGLRLRQRRRSLRRAAGRQFRHANDPAAEPAAPV